MLWVYSPQSSGVNWSGWLKERILTWREAILSRGSLWHSLLAGLMPANRRFLLSASAGLLCRVRAESVRRRGLARAVLCCGARAYCHGQQPSEHEGIETVSCATESLVVANGGLGNGVSRTRLLLVLETCGVVDALLMPPMKPYSFVRYKTTEESEKACVTLNGKEIMNDLGQKIILYLNFVEKVQWKELSHQALPPGLMVVEEIVSSDDEKMLLESINWSEDTDYQNGLPDIWDSILEKWLNEGFIKHKPDQLTINQYEPGHVNGNISVKIRRS
ncbi:Alkylated DNA repair protein alkB8 [Manis javanica]|nr:Alkylated DNA repair protein alkB8 [Manis javanica]